MAAIFSANRLPCRKKSILAKVGFGTNRGLHANAAKRIFIKKHRHLHPLLATLLLNVVQYAAKCSAFWC